MLSLRARFMWTSFIFSVFAFAATECLGQITFVSGGGTGSAGASGNSGGDGSPGIDLPGQAASNGIPGDFGNAGFTTALDNHLYIVTAGTYSGGHGGSGGLGGSGGEGGTIINDPQDTSFGSFSVIGGAGGIGASGGDGGIGFLAFDPTTINGGVFNGATAGAGGNGGSGGAGGNGAASSHANTTTGGGPGAGAAHGGIGGDGGPALVVNNNTTATIDAGSFFGGSAAAGGFGGTGGNGGHGGGVAAGGNGGAGSNGGNGGTGGSAVEILTGSSASIFGGAFNFGIGAAGGAAGAGGKGGGSDSGPAGSDGASGTAGVAGLNGADFYANGGNITIFGSDFNYNSTLNYFGPVTGSGLFSGILADNLQSVTDIYNFRIDAGGSIILAPLPEPTCGLLCAGLSTAGIFLNRRRRGRVAAK